MSCRNTSLPLPLSFTTFTHSLPLPHNVFLAVAHAGSLQKHELAVKDAKKRVASALKELETISNEIHEARLKKRQEQVSVAACLSCARPSSLLYLSVHSL